MNGMVLFMRLAWRNVWRHRRRTLIVVLAIALCTAMLIMYKGLVAGFDQAVYGNAIKVMGGNIQVHAPGYEDHKDEFPMLPVDNDLAVVETAVGQPQVLAATRRINTGGMVSSREGAFAVQIIGVEPEAELPVSVIGQHVTQGRNLTGEDGDHVLIGKGLADAMEVAVGDRIKLVGRAMHNQMRQRTMTVVGVYDLGVADIEKSTIYISLTGAQLLYMREGQATEVVLWLKTLGQEDAVIKTLASSLAAWEVTSWRTNLTELTKAMAMEAQVMDAFGVIMLIIAGIGMLNLLLMAVYERTREIGILGALGLKPRQISRLFLMEGTLMGIVGAVAGVVLGFVVNAALGHIGLDFSQYAEMADFMALAPGRIYPAMAWSEAPKYIASAVVVSVIASLYPARQAAQSEPAIALHYV